MLHMPSRVVLDRHQDRHVDSTVPPETYLRLPLALASLPFALVAFLVGPADLLVPFSFPFPLHRPPGEKTP